MIIVAFVAYLRLPILNKQVVDYFESNNLFCDNQHGFRVNHSCETALISIIDYWKELLGNNEIILALFLDFKKAYDLVKPELLKLKLFHYGFNNDALALIQNYFQNRSHITRINSCTTPPADILEGLPQGSVLGGTLFDVYINDFHLLIKMFTILFADDTTVTDHHHSVDQLIINFKEKLIPALNWVKSNQMIINWNKTKAMFIHRKKSLVLPITLCIGKDQIEVVESFRLLGVQLDNRLKFDGFLSSMKKSANAKLYSIKKLFFLSYNVRVHFFKAFIQPHFDYCAALTVYMNKTQIEKIEKFHKIILFRLLNTRLFGLNHQEQKSQLVRFNLLPIRLRIFFRLNIFCHKIMNNQILKSFYKNLKFKDKLFFRNRDLVIVPDIRANFGRASLGYFLPRFLNIILKDSYSLSAKDFKSYLSLNLDKLFLLFLNNFSN